MKAYQLKIVIKNSKPPIWRRCMVPSGITFAQLAVILNKVMGWSGSHLSEFEFYHRELRIVDQIDEYETYGFDRYDLAEASDTYIREYMEENDWFTYTYDFGDDWQHRVTIEEVIPEYPFNYPQVIKYKGACPMEDCGGIFGYYECLGIMSDENHPEHTMRCQWAKEQGYSPEYDMDSVNEELRGECFLSFGKKDKRSTGEIYQDLLGGKFGLQASKSDKNKKTPRRSNYHKTEDVMQRLADMFREYQDKSGIEVLDGGKTFWQHMKEETEPKVFLKDILADFERKDLVEIALEKGMRQFEKYGKAKLVDALAKEMLKPEEAARYFACVGEEERDAFEQAIKDHGTSWEIDRFLRLYLANYVGVREDGLVIIPEDVQAAYQEAKADGLEEKRKRLCALADCFSAISSLYGIVPAEIMVKLYEAASGETIGIRELEDMFGQIPGCYMESVYKNGVFYHKQLYPDDRGLLDAQGDKEFYIPTGEEIRDLGKTGYLQNDKYLKDFIRFLVRAMRVDQEDAGYLGMLVQHEIAGAGVMQDVMDLLESHGVACRNDRELKKLVAEINKLWNNTRMLLNRGYTPAELTRLEQPGFGGPVKTQNNVINLAERQQRKEKKIYPNDPCPCGSGKKYKNCCGKNR